jgi:hypothetical protein
MLRGTQISGCDHQPKFSANCLDALFEVNFLNVAGREYVIHVEQAHE